MKKSLLFFFLLFFFSKGSIGGAIKNNSLAKRERAVAKVRKKFVRSGKKHFVFILLGGEASLLLGALLSGVWVAKSHPVLLFLSWIALSLICGGITYQFYKNWKQTLKKDLEILFLRSNQQVTLVEQLEQLTLVPAHVGVMFDLVLLILLLLGAYRGYKIGFVSQMLSTFNIFIFLVLGIHFFEYLVEFLQEKIPSLEGSAHFLGFFILFILFLVLVFLLDKLVRYVMRMTFLGYVDSLLGSAIGVAQTAIFLATLIATMKLVSLEIPGKYTERMYIYKKLQEAAPYIVRVGGKMLPGGGSLLKKSSLLTQYATSVEPT